jgi:hypothetical protein
MAGALLSAMICWICALIFLAIGAWALAKSTPMHFWAGTTVKPEEITDVKGYNRANAALWIGYGSIYVLAGILALIYGPTPAGILVGISCVPGLFILIGIYLLIYRRYRVK